VAHYWTILILGTTLCCTILGLFGYKLLWEAWKDFRRDKLRPLNKRKARSKWFGNPKTTKWYNHLMNLCFVSFVFLAVPAFCAYLAVPPLLDLPAVVTGNYTEVTGVVSGFTPVTFGGGRSSGYPYYVYLDEVFYNSVVSLSGLSGKTVTAKVLPHTKLILSFTE
jgi:uncharacterized membrane protein YbhN (UPF0104 family)